MKTLLVLQLLLLPFLVKAQCEGYEASGHLGYFSDGSEGSNYMNNQNCTWTFTSDFDTQVRVGFFDFSTEPVYDVLRIYDGPDANHPLMAELSGTLQDPTPQYRSSGNSITMVWTSDEFSVPFPGFNGYWDAYRSETESCNGVITAIPAEGFPDDSEFRWNISPPGAELITWNFNSIDMENFVDFVRIYDGIDVNAPLLGEFTGQELPADPIVASSGHMFITATTDGSISSAGFSGNYACSTCHGITELTEASGIITDGSGEFNYSGGLDCGWLIQPPGAEVINMTITALNITEALDNIRIYDGTDSNGELLGFIFDNESLNSSYEATSGAAFIRFTTSSGGNQGWEIEYSSSTVDISELEQSPDVSAFPNPANDILNLQFDGSLYNPSTISLFDMHGREIPIKKPSRLSDGTLSLNLAHLAPGTYVLIMNDDSGMRKQIRIQKLN